MIFGTTTENSLVAPVNANNVAGSNFPLVFYDSGDDIVDVWLLHSIPFPNLGFHLQWFDELALVVNGRLDDCCWLTFFLVMVDHSGSLPKFS